MALLTFHDKRQKTVSRETAQAVWDVLTGKAEPDVKQEQFCLQVNTVTFDWRTAPDDYIEFHLDNVLPLALAEWAVNDRGQVTRPSTEHGWQFAKKWGLWDNGATMLAAKYAKVAEVPAAILPVDFSESAKERSG